MYADKITDSMKRTIDETNRRREKQIKYNIANNITPKQIFKAIHNILKNDLHPVLKNNASRRMRK